MCLYPSIIENPKYAKSNENRKRVRDYRLRWIQIPCGHCEECRRAKANEWRVRLMEEIKSNSKNIIFATLTFSEESLKKLEYDEEEPNKEETTSIIEKRIWEVKQEMFKGWKGFIDTANQLWDQMIKWQPIVGIAYRDWETTIDGKIGRAHV